MHEGRFGKFDMQIKKEMIKKDQVNIVTKPLINRSESRSGLILHVIEKETRKLSFSVFERE